MSDVKSTGTPTFPDGWDEMRAIARIELLARIHERIPRFREDVVAAVTSKMFASLANYDPQRSSFQTWLNTLTVYTALQLRESTQKHEVRFGPLNDKIIAGHISDDDFDAVDSGFETEQDAELASHVLVRAMQECSHRERQIAEALLNGLAHAEVADLFDMTCGAVAAAKFRFVKKAKSILKDVSGDDSAGDIVVNHLFVRIVMNHIVINGNVDNSVVGNNVGTSMPTDAIESELGIIKSMLSERSAEELADQLSDEMRKGGPSKAAVTIWDRIVSVVPKAVSVAETVNDVINLWR